MVTVRAPEHSNVEYNGEAVNVIKWKDADERIGRLQIHVLHFALEHIRNDIHVSELDALW